jgi:GH25 family lysozyme M1 (1,4-beta-N-acetylmuramidase)
VIQGRDPTGFCVTSTGPAGSTNRDLRAVFDIEAFGQSGRLTAEKTHDRARGFVEEIETPLGKRPIVYTGGFWRHAMGNPAGNLDCRLWLAAFVEPFVAKPWASESCSILQHTDDGRCPGIPPDTSISIGCPEVRRRWTATALTTSASTPVGTCTAC